MKIKNTEEKERKRRMLRREVEVMLNRGCTKEWTLEVLDKDYHDKEFLMEILDHAPSMAVKKKYGKLNHILFVLLAITFLADCTGLYRMGEDGNIKLNVCLTIALVIDVFFLRVVKKYRMQQYQWIMLRAFISLLIFVVSYFPYNEYDNYLLFTSFGASYLAAILGMWLIGKLCTKREPSKKQMILEDGTIIKNFYEYPD